MAMIFKKSELKRIVAFTVLIASVLIGMTFIVNGNAFASEEQVAVEDRPVFNPFFTNNPDLDRFFFERDFLGIGGEFEDNPLFKQDNQNAFERPEDFRADDE